LIKKTTDKKIKRRKEKEKGKLQVEKSRSHSFYFNKYRNRLQKLIINKKIQD
jgi:hypothetical protein